MKKETRDILMKKAAKIREETFTMECAKDLADYIMEFEDNDFVDNPSRTHVYYKACVVLMGRIYAEKILADAIKDLSEDTDNKEEHYDEYW
jgi:hypothetical protein